ncbi:hypothetical protein F4X88_12680 [Candidatus Poribacteria bacterium]|nr:hypothetical protein [Candidatus Poribacteria bacterium]MYA57146.1 hypothetical protein [Candidatus Poribacteria bacterium]
MQVEIERFSDLRQTLETMMQRIEVGEDIMEQLDQINALSQALAPTAPKMLLHYLERKSYTKALALLETFFNDCL